MSVIFINTEVNELKTIHVKWSCPVIIGKNVLQPEYNIRCVFSKYLAFSLYHMYQTCGRGLKIRCVLAYRTQNINMDVHRVPL